MVNWHLAPQPALCTCARVYVYLWQCHPLDMQALQPVQPLGISQRANHAPPQFNFGVTKPFVAAPAASGAAEPEPHKKKRTAAEDSDRAEHQEEDVDPRELEDAGRFGPPVAAGFGIQKADPATLANRKIIRRGRNKRRNQDGAAGAAGDCDDNVPSTKGLFSKGGAPQPTAAAAAPAAPAFIFKPQASQQLKKAPFQSPVPKATAPKFTFGVAPSKPSTTPNFSFKLPSAGGASAQAPSAAPALNFKSSSIPVPVAETCEESHEAGQEEVEPTVILPGVGEEDELTEREHKAKLYKLTEGAWAQVGSGMLKLNRHKGALLLAWSS
jgi:hypothetical protein